MSQKRREGYWPQYHRAHSREIRFLTDAIVLLITKELPRPQPIRSRKGGPNRVHSQPKMDCICLLMISLGMTLRDMECLIPELNLPWEEPIPDHTTMARHPAKIPIKWLETATARTAQMCLGEAGWKRPMAAADSTGVETDKYRKATRPDKIRREFVQKKVRIYLKWHILAIPELKIILASCITPGNRNDSPILRKLFATMQRLGMYLNESPFCADKGYDAETNCKAASDMGMIPHIPQKAGAVNRGKPNRRKAARLFDRDTYRYRGMIEGMFGAEESKSHGLYCRFRKVRTRRRFGLIKAIGWNIRTLNRLKSANEIGIELEQYVG